MVTQISSGQKATSLQYGKEFRNQEIKLPNLTQRDTNKIIILIFIKDSYKEENTWLRKIDEEHIIDTSHVVIYKINLPAMCDTTPSAQRIVINNLNLYNFPNHHKQIQFEIILQANENAKVWALNKLVARSNLFTPLNNDIPEDVSNPKKLNSAKVYSITDDKKFKDDFIFLVSKSPEYLYINSLQNRLQDSLNLLKKQYFKIDSLYNLKINQKIIIEFGTLPKYFSTNAQSSIVKSSANHQALKYCRSFNNQSQIHYSLGVGMDKINFNSNFNPEKLTLGYFTDEQGDQYKSEILNFKGTEYIIIKNYNIEFGLNYYFKSGEVSKRKLNWYCGFQFAFNSKPVIEKTELLSASNLQETRQYEVLNFDKLTVPTILNIDHPDNFRSYYTNTSILGVLLKLGTQFSLQTNLIYRASSNLANRQIPIIRKESENFIYSPIIFSQQQLNINSIGFMISLGYDIH